MKDKTIPRLTKEQAAVVGAFTGVACGPFADIQELAGEVLGRPVWTHEFGRQELWEELQHAVRPLFLSICRQSEEA